MLRGLVVTIVAAFAVGTLSAQGPEQVVINQDTVTYIYTPIDQTSRTQTGIEGFGLRLNDYLTYEEDDPREVKFSAIGAPSYSESTGWRLVGVATLHYRTSAAPLPHSLSLSASASLKGCYGVSFDGVNHFGTRHRLGYGGSFALDNRRLYGLDYATSLQGNYGEYRARNYGAYILYDFTVAHGLTIGVRADYINKNVVSVDAYTLEIISDAVAHISAFGVGVGLEYTTCRTEDINLTRGVMLAAKYKVSPKVLNNIGGGLHEVSVVVDWYYPLWRGGLLALDLYGEYHSRNTPWMCRSMLGGDSRMRGYYLGRYNGNALITTQLELRQRVWEGLVVAGWGGCGTIFSEGDSVAWNRALPTYGAGIRWYFNPTSLVRIDCGFGRNCHAFIVGYTEAF